MIFIKEKIKLLLKLLILLIKRLLIAISSSIEEETVINLMLENLTFLMSQIKKKI